jgi:membrane protein implicated in regulation of membrane protease activity
MMLKLQPWKMIALGGAMMLVSMVLPWLMVLQILRSTFFLNFLAYGLSVAGMLIGFIGMVSIVKIRRTQQKYKDQYEDQYENHYE